MESHSWRDSLDRLRQSQTYYESSKKAYLMAPASTQPRGMGYASYEVQYTLYPMLIKAIQATSSKERVQELAGEFLRDLEAEARSYGVESAEFSSGALEAYITDIPKKKPPMMF